MFSEKVIDREPVQGWLCELVIDHGDGLLLTPSMHPSAEAARDYAMAAMQSGMAIRATVVQAWAVGVKSGRPQPQPRTVNPNLFGDS
jgi:hypothetical protein